MTRWPPARVIFAMTLMALSLQCTGGFADSAPPPRVPWRELTFQTSSIAGSVTTQVRLDTVPATAAANSLIDYPESGASQPSGDDVLVMTVRTALRIPFSKEKRYEGKVWLNPDGSALQRVRRSFGRDPSEKTYRYGASGVYRVRREPAVPQEKDQSPQRWTRARGTFHPYGAGSGRCSLVSDPTGLLYLVSAFEPASLGPGLCAFNQRRLYQVRVDPVAEDRVRWHDPRRGSEGGVAKQRQSILADPRVWPPPR